MVNVYSYDEEELLGLSNVIGAVFLLDQARDLEEIIKRLKKLMETIKKMEPEEYRIFTAWTENLLTRGVLPENKDEIAGILKNARPEEVEKMISNVEKVLKKSWEDARNEGMEKGMEKAKTDIARQMLIQGFDVETIADCTGLSKEEIEKLK